MRHLVHGKIFGHIWACSNYWTNKKKIVFLSISPVHQSINKSYRIFEPRNVFWVWALWTETNIKDHLSWTKYAHGRFWQEQTSQKFWGGTNVSMDILDRTKCPLIHGPLYICRVHSPKANFTIFRDTKGISKERTCWTFLIFGSNVMSRSDLCTAQ